MTTELLVELFGYLGSVLVVVSILMASVVKLRVINTFGSVISGTYALIIGSFPLALMNVCLLVINIYNLFKLLKTRQQYDLVCVKKEDSFLQYVLERYREDINTYFPGFEREKGALDTAYMICCDGEPAGVFMGKKREDGTVDVFLDYSTPTYRDCSEGEFLYPRLAEEGFAALTFAGEMTDAHKAYMKKMGFTEKNGAYVRALG